MSEKQYDTFQGRFSLERSQDQKPKNPQRPSKKDPEEKTGE